MHPRSIAFDNGRGCRLAGTLHGELSQSLVISCHGMLSSKDGDKHRLLARELERLGVSCLRFDFAGRGESEGSLFELSYSNQQSDLEAVIDAVCQSGVERIALFGSSMGGAVAYLAAARDERIVAVASLAAVGHPSDIDNRYPEAVRAWHQQGYVESEAGRIGRGFYDDALSHDVLAAVRVLRAPILVVHGEEDEVVPSSDAVDIASSARNASLELVSGADHRFSNPIHLRPAMRRIAEFLAAQLQPRQAASAP